MAHTSIVRATHAGLHPQLRTYAGVEMLERGCRQPAALKQLTHGVGHRADLYVEHGAQHAEVEVGLLCVVGVDVDVLDEAGERLLLVVVERESPNRATS